MSNPVPGMFPIYNAMQPFDQAPETFPGNEGINIIRALEIMRRDIISAIDNTVIDATFISGSSRNRMENIEANVTVDFT